MRVEDAGCSALTAFSYVKEICCAGEQLPISFQLDEVEKILHFRVVGEWSTDEMLESVSAGLDAIRGTTGYAVLSDHTGIGSPATPEQISRLVDVLAGTKELSGCRAAVVVAKPASYGMMRIFSARTEPLGIDLRVFWDRDEALRFLREG